MRQIAMLTYDSESQALAFSVAEAALIDDAFTFSDNDNVVVDCETLGLAPDHLPAAAGFDFEEEVSGPPRGGNPDALFEAVQKMTLRDDESGAASAWLFEEEDSSTSSDSRGNEDDANASTLLARNLAIEAVSAELQDFSEGPKCAPRCSRLRRHFSERSAGDPATALTLLNALGGVLVESIFGAALLKVSGWRSSFSGGAVLQASQFGPGLHAVAAALAQTRWRLATVHLVLFVPKAAPHAPLPLANDLRLALLHALPLQRSFGLRAAAVGLQVVTVPHVEVAGAPHRDGPHSFAVEARVFLKPAPPPQKPHGASAPKAFLKLPMSSRVAYLPSKHE